jgi:hypothetical protein
MVKTQDIEPFGGLGLPAGVRRHRAEQTPPVVTGCVQQRLGGHVAGVDQVLVG